MKENIKYIFFFFNLNPAKVLASVEGDAERWEMMKEAEKGQWVQWWLKKWEADHRPQLVSQDIPSNSSYPKRFYLWFHQSLVQKRFIYIQIYYKLSSDYVGLEFYISFFLKLISILVGSLWKYLWQNMMVDFLFIVFWFKDDIRLLFVCVSFFFFAGTL